MKAQVTLFVIIAILIVSAAGTIYYLSSQASKSVLAREQAIINSVPEKFRPAEENFMSCLKGKANDALVILGAQAGYISLPDEDPASDYMPFSNTADLLGAKVPYWWYVSGNNLQKNQVPSLSSMQNQIEDYMDQNAPDCESSLRLLEGFEVNAEQPKTTATINDDYVDFSIEYPISIAYANSSLTVQKQVFTVPMQLGKMYKISRQVMDKENENYTFEERTLDTIFLYPEIPSTSLSFECSPKLWTKTAVQESVKKVILNNIPFIKFKGTNYAKSNKYFEIDVGKTDKSISTNILALTNPFKFEVIPSDGELLKGQQIIGEGENEALDYIKNLFCISSYHFVYTVGYPVIVQMTDKNGYLFQFSFLSLVVNNQPKENRVSGEGYVIEPELCNNKLANEKIFTFTADEKGNIIPLNDVGISYKCISTTCEIGKVKKDSLEAKFPQCVNGFLMARKEGYNPAKYMISTNTNDQEINMVLEKYINLSLNIFVIENGKSRSLKDSETVVIDLKNELKDHSLSMIYPAQNHVNLLEGNYSVKMSLFEKGSFIVVGKTITQCTSVPRAGVLGVLGFMEDKCFDFSSPDLKMDQVFGGGSEFSFNVEQGKSLNLYLLKTLVPKNVDDLSAAYATAKAASSDANFKQPEIK